MPILTVTAKGQITLRKEILQHLGVDKGGKIDVELEPNGRALIRAARPKGDIRELFGYFKKDENTPSLTLEEIETVIQQGWAGIREPDEK